MSPPIDFAHVLARESVNAGVCTPRPTLSQFWSIEIRRPAFLNYTKFSDLLLVRHTNSERAGREAMQVHTAYHVWVWARI